MSRSNTLVLIILLIIILAVAWFTFGKSFGANQNESISTVLQVGDSLPYTDLDEIPVDLNDYDGKVLVINTWATWCPFCANELPDFDALGAEYKNQGVVVLAINRAEAAATARAFVKSINTPPNITFLLDADDVLYKSIGGFSMPETIFYHKDGTVAVHKRGFMTLEEMRQHVETALAEIEK